MMASISLGTPEPVQESTGSTLNRTARSKSLDRQRQRRDVLFFVLLTVFLAAVAAASIFFLDRSRVLGQTPRPVEPLSGPVPTRAISDACATTRFPELCLSYLVGFPGALAAPEGGLAHVSVNMTLRHVGDALYSATAYAAATLSPLAGAAYDDCMELLSASLDQLSRSLLLLPRRGAAADDVLTWLSAAVTNQDTCEEGIALADVDGGGFMRRIINESMKDLPELLSISLAIFAAERGSDGAGLTVIPAQNKRRLLKAPDGGFPSWVSRMDQRLMEATAGEIQADFVVAQDGGEGTYPTISAAVKDAPENSKRRIVIYVKEGKYEENVRVGRKKTNLMFVGDGKGVTVVAGSRSVGGSHYTTFQSATFGAMGSGLILRDMTVENTAGPARHQAVALRVGGDRSVLYRCSIEGYQDTLYAHSQRQFYRECDVFGTVDFVFGNAAAVLQNCSLISRRPLASQKITITAQGRKDPNQNTGFSFHDCSLVPDPDIVAAGGGIPTAPTFLGRPWKAYSRVIYMMSYMGPHIEPSGWLAWNGGFGLSTLYYGEYMNYGPGAGVGKRVTWRGFHVITATAEAEEFTVSKFISGSKWLPATGVSFVAGLSG